MKETRTESDSMGAMELPAEALWGAQTQRAVENFNVSPHRIPLPLLESLAFIKEAAAAVNGDLGLLDKDLAEAIVAAALKVRTSPSLDQFPIDVFQTGSGTSWNMNMNEVLANMANLALGGERGSKSPVHPNDHVNLGQSSNDVIPAAINVAVRREAEKLEKVLAGLGQSLSGKAREFAGIPKLGRTHLQDAVVMNLGQEFSAYATQMEKGCIRIRNCYPHLEELALGGTAVGTGMNTHPEFGRRGAEYLNRATGIPFRRADNLFEALSARDSNLELMGAVNTVATSLMKIGQDLRLLASGPRSALGEITLPALQPGSSIMPGKVNPVIPEMVIQAAAHVMGKHLAVTIACQNGPLELNIMQPLIAFEVLSSLDLLRRCAEVLESRCVAGITAHEERCRGYIEQSLAMVTPLAREIGYDRAAALAYQAYRQNRTIREVAREAGVVAESRLDELLDVEAFKGL